MNENKDFKAQNEDISTESKKASKNIKIDVNNPILQRIRGVILQLLEIPDMTKAKIGQNIGCSGNYVQMLLNYKAFPKRAEFQIKLLRKFQNVAIKFNIQ